MKRATRNPLIRCKLVKFQVESPSLFLTNIRERERERERATDMLSTGAGVLLIFNSPPRLISERTNQMTSGNRVEDYSIITFAGLPFSQLDYAVAAAPPF